MAYDPRILIPFSHEGDTDEMRVQDASAFVDEGEELSFWELMVRRCASEAGRAHLLSDTAGNTPIGMYGRPQTT